MNRLVSKILNFMVDNNVISTETEEIEFYWYGIEITLSSLFNIFIISIIGIITDHIVEGVVFLAVFILTRSFTGGFHANTYIKCNLVTSVSFILLLLVFEATIRCITLEAVLGIAAFQITIIALLSPIENKNKLIAHKIVYKIISAVLSVSLSGISIILIENGIELGLIVLLTLTLVSILMIFTKLIKRRSFYED